MEYRTTDIVLAAFLKINNCSMVSIEKQGQKGTFVFENIDENLIKTFHLSQALVEPVAFHATIKQLTTSVRQI